MAEQGSTEVVSRGRAGKRAFPEISPRTWEHPADRAALNALKKIPGFDELLRKFIGSTTERSLRLLHLASAVRVNDRQFPRINVLLQEASACLDAEHTPELYIVQHPILNGTIIGVDKPFITLTSSIVHTMSDDELIAVIGHELGHCLSGHALYKTLLAMLLQVSLSYVRVGQLIVLPILLALLEWDRKSELSADRAGLLVCQETGGSYDLLMKLAGGGDTSQLNIGAFFEQAEEYRKDSGFLDQVYKVLNLLGQRHPFAVLRLTELKTWVDAGSYQAVLDGDYVRRGQEPDDAAADFKEAAGSYQEGFEKAKETVWGGIDSIKDTLDGLFKRPESTSGKEDSKSGS